MRKYQDDSHDSDAKKYRPIVYGQLGYLADIPSEVKIRLWYSEGYAREMV